MDSREPEAGPSADNEPGRDSWFDLVYDELRRLAQSYLRAERPEHTLQATALVHDPVTGIAIGHPGSIEGLPESFRHAKTRRACASRRANSFSRERGAYRPSGDTTVRVCRCLTSNPAAVRMRSPPSAGGHVREVNRGLSPN